MGSKPFEGAEFQRRRERAEHRAHELDREWHGLHEVRLRGDAFGHRHHALSQEFKCNDTKRRGSADMLTLPCMPMCLH